MREQLILAGLWPADHAADPTTDRVAPRQMVARIAQVPLWQSRFTANLAGQDVERLLNEGTPDALAVICQAAYDARL